jgi:hypothetical protein
MLLQQQGVLRMPAPAAFYCFKRGLSGCGAASVFRKSSEIILCGSHKCLIEMIFIVWL